MAEKPRWIDRPIRAPDADYLEPEDLRQLFPSMSREWFDQALKNGIIPPPVRFSTKSTMFGWEHAVYLALWLQFFGHAMTEQERNEGDEKVKMPDQRPKKRHNPGDPG